MDDFLTPFQKLSYASFYNASKKSAEKNYKLREWMEKAHMPMLAEVFIATVWMTTLIASIIGVLMFLIFLFVLIPLFAFDVLLQFIFLIVGLVMLFLGPIVYLGLKKSPSMKANSRGRDVDVYLPYAANFVAAMAAANATPMKIFMSLSGQNHIYGEISNEAKWIYRDMVLLGTDLLTSLKRAVKRAPSVKFQEFLQGIVGTLTSGGDLKLYFLNRGEYYMMQNRREQKTFLDTLAFMAESYVIVAVAMPMFLMIILTITFWISGAGYSSGDSIMYLFSFLAMPVVHFAYVTFVKISTPKV